LQDLLQRSFVKITKGRNLAGVGVQILFQVSQHVRDSVLMKSFIDYFNCGHYVQPLKKEWGYYQCTKFTHNFEIIRSFFNEYPIQGVKFKDFTDWEKVGIMIKNKEHLTPKGASIIIQIKSNMNTGRLFEDKD
jgi:LAGLIDADG endonuclease